MKSWKAPTNDVVERALSSVKKQTDRQYFFSRLNNPEWVEPLRTRGYFSSPPGVKELPNGNVQYPYWPELSYLVTVVREVPGQVIDIVLNLPKTDNPRVYDEILEIALKLDGEDSAQLLPKLLEYTQLGHQFLAHRYPELLRHWANQGNIDEALEIVKILVPFQEDPRYREKQSLRKKDASALGTMLEPSTRFQRWDYQQILEKGVRPIADKAPFPVARILIDATADVIRMSLHPDDLNKGQDQDYSEFWCRKLDRSDLSYQHDKEVLVHTLTYACEQVYTKCTESTASLDDILRSQRWKVFKRLRQHLYAMHPTDLTLPWIRDLIFAHEDYANREYRFEFQLMIRHASEKFGDRLLSEEEQLAIFDAILLGPSQEEFREWMGENYSEEAFEKRKHYFHQKQLRPFKPLLSGKYKSYFDALEAENTEELTDDEYCSIKMGRGGVVTYRSPKPLEELETLPDDELLAYINNWDENHHDKDDWLVEINITALAAEFGTLFRKKIVPDGMRLGYWLRHRDLIERPVYVATMVKAMQELVKAKDFDNFERWIEFCAWVLSHQEHKREGDESEPRDDSRDCPDWRSSRREVVDFIDLCLEKETETPFDARNVLADLLRQVLNQFDYRLDCDDPVLLDRGDQVTEAINNTRSRAFESLINFGFWVRRHDPSDPVQEVIEILSERMATDAEFPLTQPEHALLAMNFGRLCALDRDWTTNQKNEFFPQDDETTWRNAFQSFIRFNQPYKVAYEILREDYEFALENLNLLSIDGVDSQELIDRLGQHLFTYYLWGTYPLTGNDSLIERFYEKTHDDPKRWAQLFEHVGWMLRNSDEDLDKNLVERTIDYFDSRLEIADAEELKDFSSWLEAECFEKEWRLAAFAKVLDIDRHDSGNLASEVRALRKLLREHLSQVMQCFAKLMRNVSQDSHFYVLEEDAKPILIAGLSSADSLICEYAESARESLLQIGRFDFLDLE